MTLFQAFTSDFVRLQQFPYSYGRVEAFKAAAGLTFRYRKLYRAF
jgi:hypothetical protein